MDPSGSRTLQGTKDITVIEIITDFHYGLCRHPGCYGHDENPCHKHHEHHNHQTDITDITVTKVTTDITFMKDITGITVKKNIIDITYVTDTSIRPG
jgi:hypothetical protein